MARELEPTHRPIIGSIPRRLRAPLRAVFCALALTGPGCSSTDDGTDGETAGSSQSSIRLQNEQNYSSTTKLTIPTIETAPGDIEVCWSKVTNDIQCHEVDPESDLDNVALVRFKGMSKSEVQASFATAELSMSDVDAFFQYETNHQDTCVDLSSLELYGKEIDVEQDYVADDDSTYVLLVAHGTTPGVGTRTMAFLDPTEGSDVTSVQAPPGCGSDAPILDYTAKLSSETVKIPMDGPWVVDWKSVTRDGQGNALAYASIDRILVGFYEGMTVSDIEDQILDLEILPTAMWEAELSGVRTADLADTKDRDSGAPFDGFERDAEGVWLLGLTCSTCQNPAPLVLVVLDPSETDAGA